MSEKSESSRKMDPAIITALIGGIVTIVVTFMTVFGDRLFTPEPTPIPTVTPAFTAASTSTPAPTDTASPGEPTSTPAPTDTPVPSVTPTATPIPIGADWSQGCISSLWQPYSSAGRVDIVEKDGCLIQTGLNFFARNGELSFVYEARLSSAEVRGMFAPLSSEGTASIRVGLKDLNTSDIWIGLFAGPSIDSQGLLMTIPSGPVGARPFVAWQMPGLDKITTTQTLNQGSGYAVRFEFTAGSVRAVVPPNVFATNYFPISSSQKWLFIGYQARNGTNRIEASFFDLNINP